jgi:hypothetical protein
MAPASVLGIALGLSTLLALACAPAQPPTVSMRVRGGLPDATVIIDDLYIGALSEVARRGVALPPGKHRISVERSGHFPWDKLVEVREGDPPLHLDVVLTAIPD